MQKFFIKYILFIVIILVGVCNAQEVICNHCSKNIIGEYIVVDGNAYHKNHFKCANCGNTINGQYYSSNTKYYDEKCYSKIFLPKCSICNEPISGEYLIDSFGMKIHKHHENNLIRCDNCNRAISDKTTNGGVKYEDGRNICNVCFKYKISSKSEYQNSLSKIAHRLNNYGMTFNLKTVNLESVNLKELQEISANMYSNNIKGYTYTQIESIGSRRRFQHTIYVLNNIPLEYIESTIAHELMHVWMSENLNHKLSSQLEEGSCNYISYTYLKAESSNTARDIIKQLYENPDNIYGDGYRKVYDRFKGESFNDFLEYLKKNKSI